MKKTVGSVTLPTREQLIHRSEWNGEEQRLIMPKPAGKLHNRTWLAKTGGAAAAAIRRLFSRTPELERYVVLYCRQAGCVFVYGESQQRVHTRRHEGDRVLWSGRACSPLAALEAADGAAGLPIAQERFDGHVYARTATPLGVRVMMPR